MSRNLTTSQCCEHIVRLEDVLGKPLEARRYADSRPDFGTRWDCPTCGTAYFVIIRYKDEYWSHPVEADMKEFMLPGGRTILNHEVGRFVRRNAEGRPVSQTGYFVLDLSYYESFNDEHDYDCELGNVVEEQPNGESLNVAWCTKHDVRYHDEHERGIADLDAPRWLVRDNAEDVQWVW